MIANKQIELLKSYLNGDLAESQAAECRRLLNASTELRQEFERLQRLYNIISESSDSFDPFFATRVMARIQATVSPIPDFATSLNRLFKRLAIATTIMIFCFTSYNVISQWEYRQVSSPFEMAFALPPATVESSITYLDFEE